MSFVTRARCHVLGHGFGGMLAVQALADSRLEGVATLTLLSAAPSWARHVADRTRQVSAAAMPLCYTPGAWPLCPPRCCNGFCREVPLSALRS